MPPRQGGTHAHTNQSSLGVRTVGKPRPDLGTVRSIALAEQFLHHSQSLCDVLSKISWPGSILFQSAQSSRILTESHLRLPGVLEMLFADGRWLALCDRHQGPRSRCLAGREGSRVLFRGSSGRSKPCRRHLDRAQQPQRRAAAPGCPVSAAPGCPVCLSTSSCTSGTAPGSLQKIMRRVVRRNVCVSKKCLCFQEVVIC